MHVVIYRTKGLRPLQYPYRETRDNGSRKDPPVPTERRYPKPPLSRSTPLIYTDCLSSLSLTFFFASGPPLLRNSSCDRATQNQPTFSALTKCSSLRGLLLAPIFLPHTGTPGGKRFSSDAGGNKRDPFRVPRVLELFCFAFQFVLIDCICEIKCIFESPNHRTNGGKIVYI